MALISFITLLMVRVRDPMLPRALFTVLNTLMLFPSGAIYPIYGFPEWLKVIRSLLLRDVALLCSFPQWILSPMPCTASDPCF